MIERAVKQVALPAHSVSIDQLASVCNSLVGRLNVESEPSTLIYLITKENRAMAFESVQDLLEHKSSVHASAARYAIEIEGFHPVLGRQFVEIAPPAIPNPVRLQATITAFGQDVGWCADIVETALAEYSRYKLKFGWIYKQMIFLPFLIITGLVAGALFPDGEEWNERNLLLVPFLLFAALLCWVAHDASRNGKTAQVRLTDTRPSNWPQYAALMVGVLQCGTALLSFIRNFTDS